MPEGALLAIPHPARRIQPGPELVVLVARRAACEIDAKGRRNRSYVRELEGIGLAVAAWSE
jgi:hypothetical protein